MFRELAHIESLLAETYRDRVAYELLQNSDDANSRTVTIRVSPGSVRWANDGRPLTSADVNSLCRSATSTKSRGESIGYRGIGFKSVACAARSVRVTSAGASFLFDRDLAAAALGGIDRNSVPLIRVPSAIRETKPEKGVVFELDLLDQYRFAEPDPLSLLFLRCVEKVTIETPTGSRLLSAKRHEGNRVCVLRIDGKEATFAVESWNSVAVATPLDDGAIALVGRRGRLACFLPLGDHLGIPLVVSGDVLTDPSRTHAVAQDPTTMTVLMQAAQIVARTLRTPTDPHFDHTWTLLLASPDVRSELVSPRPTVASMFLSALRDSLSNDPPPFSVTPFSLGPEDLATLFPFGAPRALYLAENLSAAKSLRAGLDLPEMEAAAIVELPRARRLSVSAKKQIAERLVAFSDRTRVPLNRAQKSFAREAGIRQVIDGSKESSGPKRESRPDRADTFPALFAKWRAAESAVCAWLNGLGWELTDVSAQNMGYDLDGSDSDGRRVHVEVKKVDQPTNRFTMTTNEMATMRAGQGKYLLAIVVAAGDYSKVMLLDPKATQIPYEKVCRQWQYEFYDWASRGEWL